MISGATSYSSIAEQAYALADDPDITHVILDVESPGGTVNGVDAAAEALRYLASKKPTTAVVNDMAASGAQWLIAQPGIKIVVSKTSTVGSIGVKYAHVDNSEAYNKAGYKVTVITAGEDKALGDPSVPLDEKAQKKIKSRLDLVHQQFISSVAAGRGMSVEELKPLATGDVFNGEQAVKNGLADEIGTIHSVIEKIRTEHMEPEKNVQASATPTAQPTEPAKNMSIEDLAEQVSQLTQMMATIVASQKEQVAAAAKDRAEALLKPLVACGALTPAQVNGTDEKPGLLQAAIDNYDLVANMVSHLRPSQAIPFKSPVEPSRVANANTVPGGSAVHEVFSQLGILNGAGQIDLKRITLPLDGSGKISHLPANTVFSVDRVAPEVAQVTAQLGSWN